MDRYITFVVTLFLSANLYAIDRLAYEVVSGDGRVIIEYYEDKSSSNAKVYPVSKETNTGSLGVLSKYYENMVSGNISNIPKLFNVLDGSKERFQKFIKKEPKAYDRFSNLSEVLIQFTSLWGPYRIHGIRLKTKGGDFNWREITYCSNKDICTVSNFLDKIDYEAELYIEAIGHLLTQKKMGVYKSIDTDHLDPQKAITILPSNHQLFPNHKQYPVRVYIEPVYFKPKLFNFGESCKGKRDEKDLDALAVAGTLCLLNKVIVKEGSGYGAKAFRDIGIDIQDEQLIPTIKYFTSSKNKNTQVANQTLVDANQYIENISDWDGIRLIGKVFAGDRGVIYFQPVSKSRKIPVQVYGVIRHGEKRQVLPIAEYSLGSILTSSLISSQLEKRM